MTTINANNLIININNVNEKKSKKSIDPNMVNMVKNLKIGPITTQQKKSHKSLAKQTGQDSQNTSAKGILQKKENLTQTIQSQKSPLKNQFNTDRANRYQFKHMPKGTLASCDYKFDYDSRVTNNQFSSRNA